MAYYAALVSVVQLLKEIIHPDHSYTKSILDKQQIHVSLHEKFNLLHESLEDYSPTDDKEETADILEMRIRDAANPAEDIVESHIHSEKKGRRKYLVSAPRKAPRKLQIQRFKWLALSNFVEKKYHQDLEKVKAELDSIVQDLKEIKESHKAHAKDLLLNSCTSPYSSGGASKVQVPSGRDTMAVFDEDLMETIKAQLCGESLKLEVISIVGMGGLGKSTLARSIFDDKLIDEHFYCRAWVTVSQDYHLHNILQAIVTSLKINTGELGKGKEGVLVERIYKHLKGRRYLIVMDDMWETKVWDDMKRTFPNDNNGSRVIMTTRLSNVAFYADSSGFVHQLQLLKEDQSWNLFCEKVLCPPELEDIGRLIAERCRGLPLAIIVVAGLLSKVDKTRHDWEEIARNVSSAAAGGNDEDFSNIISLSYKHLPHHLKPCFLYLGGFPEDYEIPVSKLIKLWVAEGFLKPIESKSLEEVGEEYLDDLVDRNLILIHTWTWKRKFNTCGIHDVLRELCLQRAHYENFLHCLYKQDDFQELMENVRRLYIGRSDGSSFLKYKKENISRIRAIPFCANDSVWRHFSSDASDFKLLRVLNTTHKFNFESPNAIVQVLNLRCLALRECTICIPPSIFKLHNLQTLIFDGVSVITLPCEIWKMPHLRHVMGEKVILPPIPYGEIRVSDGIPLLGKLQTLGKVQDFIFTSNTAKMIPSLRKLVVRWNFFSKGYKNWEELGLNNLVHLRQLESLSIEFHVSEWDFVPLHANFAFPSTVLELSLNSQVYQPSLERHDNSGFVTQSSGTRPTV